VGCLEEGIVIGFVVMKRSQYKAQGYRQKSEKRVEREVAELSNVYVTLVLHV